jgi:DNA-binding NarL/FixJ family response regulator
VQSQTIVLLLCCNRLLGESVARILKKRSNFQIVTSDPVARGSTWKVGAAKPDVVVLDSLQTLDENSIFAPSQCNSRLARCVLIAMEDDRRHFLAAVRLGILGYVLHEASAVEVVTTIRAVSQGEAVCPGRYTRVLFDYFASQTTATTSSRVQAQLAMTRREQQLVPLIEHGMTNKEIANQLNLSEQTVKNHIHRILRKIGVKRRLGISEALQTQILGLSPQRLPASTSLAIGQGEPALRAKSLATLTPEIASAAAPR